MPLYFDKHSIWSNGLIQKWTIRIESDKRAEFSSKKTSENLTKSRQLIIYISWYRLVGYEVWTIPSIFKEYWRWMVKWSNHRENDQIIETQILFSSGTSNFQMKEQSVSGLQDSRINVSGSLTNPINLTVKKATLGWFHRWPIITRRTGIK